MNKKYRSCQEVEDKRFKTSSCQEEEEEEEDNR